jgi:hypothetical protein
MPNERAAILEVGETVIPKNGRIGGGSGPVTIHIHNPNMSDRSSISQLKQELGNAVADARRRHM